MSWVFVPLEIPNTATKEAPLQVAIKGVLGQVGGIVVILPITTDQHQVGVRIKAPDNALLPVVIEGSDGWLYSQKYGVTLDLRERRSLGRSAPISLTVEGFNTDAATQHAQVGIYFHPWANDAAYAVKQVMTALDAMTSRTAWPEVEKQIRRVFAIAREFLTGGKSDG